MAKRTPGKIESVMVERYGTRFMCDATEAGFLCGNCSRPLGVAPYIAQRCECDARVARIIRGWSEEQKC